MKENRAVTDNQLHDPLDPLGPFPRLAWTDDDPGRPVEERLALIALASRAASVPAATRPRGTATRVPGLRRRPRATGPLPRWWHSAGRRPAPASGATSMGPPAAASTWTPTAPPGATTRPPGPTHGTTTWPRRWP